MQGKIDEDIDLIFAHDLRDPSIRHASDLPPATCTGTQGGGDVIRMLPVFLCLIGTRTSMADKLFIGWFGPRGLASIVFAVIVVEDSHLPHLATILSATYVTVALSVLLHGVSASPIADRYARWIAAHAKGERGRMERAPAQTQRIRGRVPAGSPG